MNWMIVTYLVYRAVSVALTIWLARTLHRSGRVFLVDSFLGHEALKCGAAATDAQQALESLSTKVGAVLLVLGGMHFFNLLVFSSMRKRALESRQPPVIRSAAAPSPAGVR